LFFISFIFIGTVITDALAVISEGIANASRVYATGTLTPVLFLGSSSFFTGTENQKFPKRRLYTAEQRNV